MIRDLPKKLDSGLCVNAQDVKSCCFVNRGELVKTLTRSSDTRNELHIELDRVAWDLQRCIGWFGARMALFH